jgi:lysophospholipase L1-like esterase
LTKGVRTQKSGFRIPIGLFAIAAGLWAQAPEAPQALLSTKDLNQLCVRAGQLMEAGGVVIPELQRAAAPEIENVKQACVQLEAKPRDSQTTFLLMNNVKTYLTLSDSVPKPFPFPDTARRQLAELRDDSARLDSHFRALLDSKDAQIINSDRDNLKRYDDANRKLPRAEPSRPRVVFMGDSITDFWRLNEYFPDRDFVNRGISGQVTGEMLGRMKADVLDLRPEAMVLLAGTNDLARGISLTTIEDNFLMMADLASFNKIKVVFASVLPVNDVHKAENPANERTKDRPPVYITALNEWIQRFCAQRGYVYLDYYAAMVDSAARMKDDLSDDGLHPNSKGYRIMAPLVLEAVNKTLKSRPAVVAAPATPTAKTKK